MLLAGACDSSEEKYGTPPTVAPSASVSASPSPKLDPAQQQVVDRYLLYVRTLEKLYATTDPTNVDMSAVATGKQFRNDVETAIKMRGRGIHTRGTAVNSVSFQTFTKPGAEATITNCQDGNAMRTVDKSGEETNPGQIYPRKLLRVTLRIEAGVWKVAETEIVKAC
jgi:hypothetical protein